MPWLACYFIYFIVEYTPMHVRTSVAIKSVCVGGWGVCQFYSWRHYHLWKFRNKGYQQWSMLYSHGMNLILNDFLTFWGHSYTFLMCFESKEVNQSLCWASYSIKHQQTSGWILLDPCDEMSGMASTFNALKLITIITASTTQERIIYAQFEIKIWRQ